MAGWNFLSRARIVHIFNAVFAQHQPPVGFRLFRKVRHQRFVDTGGLVELTVPAQSFGSVKQKQLLVVVCPRHRLHTAAERTLRNRGPRLQSQIATAHLTFQNH